LLTLLPWALFPYNWPFCSTTDHKKGINFFLRSNTFSDQYFLNMYELSPWLNRLSLARELSIPLKTSCQRKPSVVMMMIFSAVCAFEQKEDTRSEANSRRVFMMNLFIKCKCSRILCTKKGAKAAPLI